MGIEALNTSHPSRAKEIILGSQQGWVSWWFALSLCIISIVVDRTEWIRGGWWKSRYEPGCDWSGCWEATWSVVEYERLLLSACVRESHCQRTV